MVHFVALSQGTPPPVDLPPEIQIAGIVFGIVFVAFMAYRFSGRLRDLKSGKRLPEFANAVEGQIVRKSSSEYPAVKFTRDGRRYVFTQWVMGTTSPAISSLEVSMGSEVFLEATEEDSQRYPTRFPRAKHVGAVGRYKVMSTNPEWASRQLNLGLSDLLGELRETLGKQGRIQLTSGRCLVEVERVIRPGEFPGMIGVMEHLVRVLEGESAEGKVLIIASTFDPAQGRCPVCASLAGANGISCTECRASHHHDCWSYIGRCGIFGCGSRQAS